MKAFILGVQDAYGSEAVGQRSDGKAKQQHGHMRSFLERG